MEGNINVYAATDKAIQVMNRDSLREFGKLKTAKFDEINLIQTVETLYRRQATKAKRRYLEIGVESYLLGLYLCGMDIWDPELQRLADGIITPEWIERVTEAREEREPGEKPADRQDAGKVINEEWVEAQMEETNFVTLYRFNSETWRKVRRLAEALEVSASRDAEIDRALRDWCRQTGQYAISITDAALLQAYEDADEQKVVWDTVHDEKVCGRCDEMDGHVFPVRKVPPKPHYGCRCRLLPARWKR